MDRVHETKLSPLEEPAETDTKTGIEVLAPEALAESGDDLPHLVFLIPGIRTDGAWTEDAHYSGLTWDGRDILFRAIRGDGGSSDGRLSSFHLVTRIGLNGYRQSFRHQIKTLAARHDSVTITICAHSMGSSVFADIIRDVSRDLEALGRQIDTVVFLGSVCHRRQAARIRDHCAMFYNDIGVRDHWPFLASIVRPDSYSDVGLWGFRIPAYARDRIFDNDHFSCTELGHLQEKIVPLLGVNARPGDHPRLTRRLSYNGYIYVKRAAWVLIAAVIALGFACIPQITALFLGVCFLIGAATRA